MDRSYEPALAQPSIVENGWTEIDVTEKIAISCINSWMKTVGSHERKPIKQKRVAGKALDARRAIGATAGKALDARRVTDVRKVTEVKKVKARQLKRQIK